MVRILNRIDYKIIKKLAMKNLIKILISIFGIVVINRFQLLIAQPVGQNENWRVMPIRSEEEFREGKIGGEGYQHLHGISRCRFNPNVIYLSQDCANVWKSNDAGTTWKKVLGKNLYGKQGQSIEVDPINPDIVFTIVENHSNPAVSIAGDFVGLYRSTNGGTSWEFVLHVPTIIHRMYQHNIAYDPKSISDSGAKTWYAAFPNQALYISEDAGASWKILINLEGHNPVFNIQCHPKDMETVYLASNQGLFFISKTTSSLQKLGDLPAGEVSSIAINEQNPEIFYTVLKGKGLYCSDNSGKAFSLLKSYNAHHVFINPGYPNIIYLIGRSSNIIISHDGGRSWNQRVRVIPAAGLKRDWKKTINGAMAGIVPNPNEPNEAVAYANAAIWKTTNGGEIFEDCSTLFTGNAWSWWNDGVAFDIANPNRFCFFCCDVGMIITENGGDYFEKKIIPLAWRQNGDINWTGMHAGDIQPTPNSKTIVASAGMYFKTKLIRSIDGGETWNIVDNNYQNNLFIAFHPHDPNLVFAGNKRSFDAGTTFKEIDYLTARNAEILGLCFAQPDIIYAMTKPRNVILRSNDRGDSWFEYVQADWYFSRLDSKPTFAANPSDPDKIYTLDKNGDLAIFNGLNWKSLGVLELAGGTKKGNFVRTVALDPRYPNIIYAGLYYAGMSHIWRSVDDGKIWEDISINCPRLGASAMRVHPLTGDLLQGTVFGTWVFPPPYKSQNSIYMKCISYETR